MPTGIARIRDGLILSLSAIGVVGTLSLTLFGASCLQMEQSAKPTNHPAVRDYGAAREPSQADLQRMEARAKVHRQHYESAEQVQFLTD